MVGVRGIFIPVPGSTRRRGSSGPSAVVRRVRPVVYKRLACRVRDQRTRPGRNPSDTEVLAPVIQGPGQATRNGNGSPGSPRWPWSMHARTQPATIPGSIADWRRKGPKIRQPDTQAQSGSPVDTLTRPGSHYTGIGCMWPSGRHPWLSVPGRSVGASSVTGSATRTAGITPRRGGACGSAAAGSATREFGIDLGLASLAVSPSDARGRQSAFHRCRSALRRAHRVRSSSAERFCEPCQARHRFSVVSP